MTTEEKYFEKIFTEGEKAKSIYKDYNFDILSEKEKKFLSSLSIFSKYKNYLTGYLLSRKVKFRDQIGYIDNYKQQLDYKNYIKYEQIKGQQYELRQLTVSIIGFGSLFTMAFFLIKKDPSKGIFRESFISVLTWLLIGTAFYRMSFNKHKEGIFKIYKELENDINTNISLKSGNSNPNYFSSEEIDDEFDD
jgi:hypothetical protein